MNQVPDLFRILPELILTLTGVLLMLVEASLPPRLPRHLLGWVAALGTLLALWASIWQLSLPTGTAFYGTIETSPFSVFFHALICGIVLVTLLLATDTLPRASHHQGEFYALVVFGAVGMCLMTGAVELLLVFIGLEISSISTYVLAGYRKDTPRSVEAAIKYFLLGSFATAFLLYGIALLFGATGSTHIYELAYRASALANQPLVWTSLALMLIGILFKVSAAPFHVWTPDVYEGSPTPVVALLSTAPKAAALALLIRVLYQIFPALQAVWQPLLLIVAALSMTMANLAALRQRNVKRMLAYSSIAHAGYMLAAFTALGTSGVTAAAFYVAAYAAMNVGVFAVITLTSGYEEKRSRIEDFRGFFQHSPALALLLVFFLAALIGIPFTGGFFAKFYLFSTVVDAGVVWLALLGLLNSGIAAAYYLRLVLALFQREPENDKAPARSAAVGVAAIVAIAMAFAATLWLGILPNPILRASQYGAQVFPAPGIPATSAAGMQKPR